MMKNRIKAVVWWSLALGVAGCVDFQSATPESAVASAPLVLTPVELFDTYVDSANPYAALGASTQLQVNAGVVGGGPRYTFLSLPPMWESVIPPGHVVVDAQIRLQELSFSSNTVLLLHRAHRQWSPGFATYACPFDTHPNPTITICSTAAPWSPPTGWTVPTVTPAAIGRAFEPEVIAQHAFAESLSFATARLLLEALRDSV